MGTGFLITGAVLVVAGAVVFALSRRRPGRWLAGTVLLSAGLLGVVTGWLLTEPNANRGEALKTGGLAAGAVVALYALWLNDRRRRTDEDRQEIERRRQDLETARADHDRERVADERFARAVELLGSDADQVRVGALHALAGLARNHENYTQTVLDVLCSYLRRPFDHAAEDVDARERVVRATAQRLVRHLLPTTDVQDAPRHNLDLTGAELAYFDISERVVGTLTMRFTTLHESNSLWGCHFHGSAWFTGARSPGILHLHDAVFHRKAWFSGFRATGPLRLARTRFLGPVKVADAEVAETDTDLREIATVE